MRITTKEVTTSALRDAGRVAFGFYSMNAPYAARYVFNCDAKEVTQGEFCSKLEPGDGYEFALPVRQLRALAKAEGRKLTMRDLRKALRRNGYIPKPQPERRNQ